MVKDCAIYQTEVAVRAEDRIERLQILTLGFGPGVKSRYAFHNGKDLPGFSSTGEHEAPPMSTLLTMPRNKTE